MYSSDFLLFLHYITTIYAFSFYCIIFSSAWHQGPYSHHLLAGKMHWMIIKEDNISLYRYYVPESVLMICSLLHFIFMTVWSPHRLGSLNSHDHVVRLESLLLTLVLNVGEWGVKSVVNKWMNKSMYMWMRHHSQFHLTLHKVNFCRYVL